jgi:hypothetical protein
VFGFRAGYRIVRFYFGEVRPPELVSVPSVRPLLAAQIH